MKKRLQRTSKLSGYSLLSFVELNGTFRRRPSDCQSMRIDRSLLFFMVSKLLCARFCAWFLPWENGKRIFPLLWESAFPNQFLNTAHYTASLDSRSG